MFQNNKINYYNSNKTHMYGYYTKEGFLGYLPSEWTYRLFETEDEYIEYFKENEM